MSGSLTKVVSNVEVLPVGMDPTTHGEIDISISTAKRFPRSIEKFRKDARSMATVDEDTAASCWYAVPRAGKKIEGPSVRLAEIVSVCYGNLRVVRRVISEDERFVTCAAYAWDLEHNILQASEVRRRITDKEGARYSDDMIGNTINAGLAIAGRNAVFATVPRSFINDIYEDCKRVSRGTLATLGARRDKALAWFKEVGIDSKRVFAGLSIRGADDLTLDHIEILQGIRTAIREGEVKPEDAFAEPIKTDAKTDPVSAIMADLGCTENDAAWVLKAWDALKVTAAARVVQVKQHKGKANDLIEMLNAMLPEPEQKTSAPDGTAGEAEARTREDSEREDAKRQDAELALKEGQQAQTEAKPKGRPRATKAPAPEPPTAETGKAKSSFGF